MTTNDCQLTQGITTAIQDLIGKVTSSVCSQLWPEYISIFNPSLLSVNHVPTFSISFEVEMTEI